MTQRKIDGLRGDRFKFLTLQWTIENLEMILKKGDFREVNHVGATVFL